MFTAFPAFIQTGADIQSKILKYNRKYFEIYYIRQDLNKSVNFLLSKIISFLLNSRFFS